MLLTKVVVHSVTFNKLNWPNGSLMSRWM